MYDQLKIDYMWLGGDVGSDLEKAFYADIGLAIGDDYLTRLEDLRASTVRNHLRGCVYQLATWFAANWWRLRWEPEIHDWTKNADWRMAHSIASVGGGFVWPNVLFASDGKSLAIASRPSERATAIEPVRYPSRLDARISAVEFEQKIDAFLDGVISRLHAFKIKGCELPGLWAEVMAERKDLKLSRLRRLEAICGYDPDEAPPAVLDMLVTDQGNLGCKALEEVAAAGRHSTAEVLDKILDVAKSKTAPTVGGFRGVLPSLSNMPQESEGERPWQIAGRLARFARSQWGLDDKPVADAFLADLVKTDPAVFSDRYKSQLDMPLAVQTEAIDKFDIYFDSTWSTSRRFAISRLIGDHLNNKDCERLLPATTAKTFRQQFQRAFAQEFLCPFDTLLAKIQTEQPEEEDITEAADYFKVSPLLVRTTLVNKGELDRETLCAPT